MLLGSFIRNLRLRWPDARIAVLCERGYAPVLEINPDVNDALPFPRSIGEWLGTLRRLRRQRFTHVFDLDNRDKTAVLTRVTGAPVRVSQHHCVPVTFRRLYTASEAVPSEFLDGRHITDLYLNLLTIAGVPVATRECRLVPREEDIASAKSLWMEAGFSGSASKVLVHPGSRSAWRVWPPLQFAAVINRLQAELHAAVGIVAGPGEQPTVDEIVRHLSTPAMRVSPNLPPPKLAALFASADVLLCHDSGPMHLAAAVGTRVVALFGSQTLSHWRPLGERHITLQPPLPCVSCVSPGKCNPADPYFNHCVRNITAERVFEAVKQSLAPARA